MTSKLEEAESFWFGLAIPTFCQLAAFGDPNPEFFL
jgi:hypothetical protein